MTHTCPDDVFNHLHSNSALSKPAGIRRPFSIFKKAARKIRTSPARQGLSQAVYQLTHRPKPSRYFSNGPFEASDTDIATKMPKSVPWENPITHYLSTEEELEEFLEVRRTVPVPVKTMSPEPASLSITAKTKARSLDDLPPEILIKIWRYVAETPSWFHVKYSSPYIFPINTRINREHWVNKRWYLAPEFRKSLCRHPVQEDMYNFAKVTLDTAPQKRNGDYMPLAQKTVDSARTILEWSKLDGCETFKVRLKGKGKGGVTERTPAVRPAVDWFFLENYVSTQVPGMFNSDPVPSFPDLERVSTVVLKLEDIYKGICRVLNSRRELKSNEPWRVIRSNVPQYVIDMSEVFGTLVASTSKLEKCLILIGDLQPGVQPSTLQEISVKWAGPERNFFIDTQREIVTSPKVSPNDRAMIRFVHQELEYFDKLQRRWRNERLRSRRGQAWLADFRHGERSKHSIWLATAEGGLWRETKDGEEWLQTPSGHWWLASVLGSPWLETEKGLAWLDSDAGTKFLDLPAACVWAGVDNDGGSNILSGWERRRMLPEKKWFKTEKGRAWVTNNCPDKLVPIAPEPPQREDGEHPRAIPSVPSAFFIHPPRQWVFLKVRDAEIQV
ncbi:hypothetical protein HD806DRAFT_75463 [Xylariaceae sp. AK1471]|nr:hypothetical protein HD806DRAFT_75463 [Xylariaceae sp. AK1471]